MDCLHVMKTSNVYDNTECIRGQSIDAFHITEMNLTYLQLFLTESCQLIKLSIIITIIYVLFSFVQISEYFQWYIVKCVDNICMPFFHI